MTYRIARGFSLFESLICLSVLSIVASLAIPAFGGILQRNRQQLAIQQLRETVNFARAAAINGAGSVSICQVTATARISGRSPRGSSATGIATAFSQPRSPPC